MVNIWSSISATCSLLVCGFLPLTMTRKMLYSCFLKWTLLMNSNKKLKNPSKHHFHLVNFPDYNSNRCLTKETYIESGKYRRHENKNHAPIHHAVSPLLINKLLYSLSLFSMNLIFYIIKLELWFSKSIY